MRTLKKNIIQNIYIWPHLTLITSESQDTLTHSRFHFPLRPKSYLLTLHIYFLYTSLTILPPNILCRGVFVDQQLSLGYMCRLKVSSYCLSSFPHLLSFWSRSKLFQAPKRVTIGQKIHIKIRFFIENYDSTRSLGALRALTSR